MEREEIIFARETEVIQIPDGIPIFVPEGTGGWVMQLLGGNFTVRLETGHLVRLAGQDASAIGKDVPDDAIEPDPGGEFDEERIWDQLRTCYDPEIPVNIVDLGLIYGFDVDESEEGRIINVTMTLTAPGCGMGQVLKDDVETKVNALPGVKDAIVELVFDPPWSPERMSEAAQLELGFF